jgi:hypothetical protein
MTITIEQFDKINDLLGKTHPSGILTQEQLIGVAMCHTLDKQEDRFPLLLFSVRNPTVGVYVPSGYSGWGPDNLFGFLFRLGVEMFTEDEWLLLLDKSDIRSSNCIQYAALMKTAWRSAKKRQMNKLQERLDQIKMKQDGMG